MPTNSFEYAIVRFVPRVERGEFLNVGVVLSCPLRDFLQARIELDLLRLRAFAPHADLAVVQAHLRALPLICEGGAEAGPIGELPQRARFHWLTAPRSTIIQLSPVHSGLCDDPENALETLLGKMVRISATDKHR